ncbi:hypothetical protein H8N01_27775 [Streptomyces sp. AC536]|uniref:hypothetical protein n=1 Tax=Streptomyces buecherae TaxID=2763006 RepID=UPI00164DDC75|nr:hypothetical protein [Streptomyces buecherae]MBC3986275.1 hypothetical protein [Streptomyces buecherae]QNJ42513.1 hypothetical protein H7H31_24370 [Streptomyces buecherae]
MTTPPRTRATSSGPPPADPRARVPARCRSLGLGPHRRADQFHRVRRAWVRLVAVPVFGCALGLASWAAPRVRPAWLNHSDSVQELGDAP